MIFTSLSFNQTSNGIIFYVYIYVFYTFMKRVHPRGGYCRVPDCQASTAAGFVLPVFMLCSVYENLKIITVVY